MSNLSIQTQIFRAYLLGAVVLVCFYYLVIEVVLYSAEDNFAERRVKIVTKELVATYANTKQAFPITIDPMLSIYDDFRMLPNLVKSQTTQEWEGIKEIDGVRDNKEISYILNSVSVNEADKRFLYFLENVTDAESRTEDVANLSGSLVFVGLALALTAFYFMFQLAAKISHPLIFVSGILSEENRDDFSPIEVPPTASKEIQILVKSINQYRKRLSMALSRERAFTGYVSHELYTPLTVIKIAAKLMLVITDSRVHRYQKKINNSALDMERLINTFLLLAREDRNFDSRFFIVNQHWLNHLFENHNHLIETTEINIQLNVADDLRLHINETLLYVVISNLLKNACVHAAGGTLDIEISSKHILFRDTGTTTACSLFDEHSETYSSHGIGLVIVRDICQKLGWSFSLLPNNLNGHDALIRFCE